MKLFLIIMLICSQVFAAFPPTAVRGQSDATGTTTFNFVTPYSQATQIAGSTALLESGNNNLLKNPSFEATTGATSWSATAGVAAVDDTTNVFAGTKSQAVTLTTVTGLAVYQDVTPTVQMIGSNFEASVAIKTSLTTLQVCARQAAVTFGLCATVQGDGNWHLYSVNMPGPASGSVGISVITTASTSGTFNIDAGYVGFARNLSNGTPNNVFSAQISATGVVSAENQDFINGNCTNPTTGNYTCTFNSNFFTTTPTCTANTALTGTTGQSIAFASQSSSAISLTITQDGVTTFNKAFNLTCTRSSTDWIQPTIQAPNWEIPSTPWTPTTAGFGTIASPSCFYSRIGDRLLGDCRFTVGTPTAVTASVTLPLGLTVNSNFNTLKCGDATTQATSTGTGVQVGSVYNVLCTGGSSTLNFGYRDNALGGLSPLVASTGFVASTPISFQFSVPIQGWTTTNTVPLLVGSVTSNATGALRIENLLVNTVCASTPCTVTSSSSSWYASVTRSTTGSYSVAVPAGVFSTAPVCTVNIGDTASATYPNARTCSAGTTTTTTVPISCGSTANLAADSSFQIICMGAR